MSRDFFIAPGQNDQAMSILVKYQSYLQETEKKIRTRFDGSVDLPPDLKRELQLVADMLGAIRPGPTAFSTFPIDSEFPRLFKTALTFWKRKLEIDIDLQKSKGARSDMLSGLVGQLAEMDAALALPVFSEIRDQEPFSFAFPNETNVWQVSIPEMSSVPSGVPADGPMEEFASPPWIRDKKLLRILGDDFSEIQRDLKGRCWKSAIILCGGSIEALLRSALQRKRARAMKSPKAPKKNGQVRAFDSWTLGDMIQVAEDLKIARTGLDNWLHGIRDYRNLVHPEKAIKGKYKIDESVAMAAWHTLNALLGDLRPKTPEGDH
jgi:hypothetical protein